MIYVALAVFVLVMIYVALAVFVLVILFVGPATDDRAHEVWSDYE